MASRDWLYWITVIWVIELILPVDLSSGR
jgi:hypothetical protein